MSALDPTTLQEAILKTTRLDFAQAKEKDHSKKVTSKDKHLYDKDKHMRKVYVLIERGNGNEDTLAKMMKPKRKICVLGAKIHGHLDINVM